MNQAGYILYKHEAETSVGVVLKKGSRRISPIQNMQKGPWHKQAEYLPVKVGPIMILDLLSDIYIAHRQRFTKDTTPALAYAKPAPRKRFKRSLFGGRIAD